MNQTIDLGAVRRGFRQPALEAQRLYRRLLDAMARPGRPQDLSEAPDAPQDLFRSTAGVALTLLDFETPVWLDPALRGGEAQAWLRFHCGCPFTDDAKAAAFALIVDAARMPRLESFNPGDARYPDRSTTLLVQVPSLVGGQSVQLAGPGIEGAVELSPAGVPDDFWTQVDANRAEFQLGVDLLLMDEERVLALPRSSRRIAASAPGNGNTNSTGAAGDPAGALKTA
jgi:alpha-D-ribose 1-methylphosphonate 5-triphosphate synthase subunit PhnH